MQEVETAMFYVLQAGPHGEGYALRRTRLPMDKHGRRILPDPDAPPNQGAWGKLCTMQLLEQLCVPVFAYEVSKSTLVVAYYCCVTLMCDILVKPPHCG